MTISANLAIDILSGKLRPNARMWRIMKIISAIFLFILPYPIHRLIGDSILFKIIVSVIIAFFFLCVVVFKHMNKFEVKGRLILDQNSIRVKIQDSEKHIEVKSVSEIILRYSGYWEQVYFLGGPKPATKNGNGNFLLIKGPEESLSYELFLQSKAMLNMLLRYMEYYKQHGIKTTIEEIG
jgi:hypothetical protein